MSETACKLVSVPGGAREYVSHQTRPSETYALQRSCQPFFSLVSSALCNLQRTVNREQFVSPFVLTAFVAIFDQRRRLPLRPDPADFVVGSRPPPVSFSHHNSLKLLDRDGVEFRGIDFAQVEICGTRN